MPITLKRCLTLALAVGGCALFSMAAAGCRDDRSDKPPRQFFPDMDDAPKWKPQTESEFFADSRTMRNTVPHTVAFSRTNISAEGWQAAATQEWGAPYLTARNDLLREDDGFYEGQAVDGKYLDKMPASVYQGATAEETAANLNAMLLRGQERFNIYCAVCHGYGGDGKGMVGVQWGGVVANFHDPKYRDRSIDQGKDGYLFHVSRFGVPGADGYVKADDPPEVRQKKQKEMKMPGYAHALNERDAWAVVAYVRALQQSHLGTINDVPEAERQKLEQQRAALENNAADELAARMEGVNR